MSTRITTLIAALALALIAPVLALAGEAQARSAERTAPEVEARAWALADAKTGEFLAGDNASARLPMASTTKIMVALAALEERKLGEQATVSPDAAAYAVPLYSNVGLYPGDVLSVRELLEATMISSGDDAAYALAEHLGDGSVDRFVEKMNQKAKEMGLEDTHFTNPIGLDAPKHYTSARDLAEITYAAFEQPEFQEIVSTTSDSIATQDREIPLQNTNELLLSYPRATGVKTGTTPGAGPSLVASASAKDESYVVVFLNDLSRFADAAEVLEYGFDRYDRGKLIVEKRRYAAANVPYRRDETVKLVAKRSLTSLVESGSRVRREVEVVRNLPDSAAAGARLGSVAVSVDGERVGEVPLVAHRGYEKASVWERLWYTVEGFLR